MNYMIKGLFHRPFGYKAIFEGKLIYNKKNNILEGRLYDYFGSSNIEGLLNLQKEEMVFVKQYDGEKRTINYYFEKRGDIWIGEFSQDKKFGGEARCELVKEGWFFKIDWEEYIKYIELSPENEEKWAKRITQDMIDEGYFKIEKDLETGRDILIPLNKD